MGSVPERMAAMVRGICFVGYHWGFLLCRVGEGLRFRHGQSFERGKEGTCGVLA